jgi:intracellular multiplication protein IcmE
MNINIKKYIKLPENSKIRVLMIALIIVIIISSVAGFIYRHNQNELLGSAETKMKPISNYSSDSSTGNASKEYMQTLLQSDQIKANNALKQGQSALPSLINSGQSYAETTGFQAKDNTCACCNKNTLTGSMLDQLVKSGKISTDVAADLQRLENQGASAADYQKELQKLVQEGKLTPQQAAELMAAYQAQHGSDAIKGAAAADDAVDKLLASGAISPETATALKALDAQHLTPAQYAEKLQELVREGKLTPEQAAQLLAAYSGPQGGSGTTAAASSPDALTDSLLASGSITPETAQVLKSLNAQHLTPDQYAQALQELVRQGKLSPEEAARLLASYRTSLSKTSDIPVRTDNLDNLTPQERQLVAMQKIQQQQQASAQQRELAIQQQAMQQQKQMENDQRLQAMQGAMSAQANTLFSSWNAPTPSNAIIIQESTATTTTATHSGSPGQPGSGSAVVVAPMIKAGSIIFAVLDTAINSDYPGPVMATVVAGKYKGAKLLGSLTTQNDRVMLQFNMMTMPTWTSTAPIIAVAINPDTARTALASDVNYHYISRYAGIFASSFLEGYATAVTDQGTTIINPVTGGVTGFQTAEYSPQARTMVALGAVGKKLSAAAQKNFDRPPTVKVDSGVGLGILFQGDVAQPNFPTN